MNNLVILNVNIHSINKPNDRHFPFMSFCPVTINIYIYFYEKLIEFIIQNKMTIYGDNPKRDRIRKVLLFVIKEPHFNDELYKATYKNRHFSCTLINARPFKHSYRKEQIF